ncbi:MAG: quinone-dependent dihydroorotate dehydrogenase [Halovenus sp.]
MSLYTGVRRLLFHLPPETAHALGKLGLKVAQSTEVTRSLVRERYLYRHRKLQVEAFGLTFPSPVGVAAGFDKNGEVTQSLADLGFGFTEVGTVTPSPQSGNPKPRLFRLPDDEGMINRLGFNGQGAGRVKARLERTELPNVPVAINVGKMNDAGEETAIADYRYVFETLYGYADYFVVNVSCPNTPETFDEQAPDHLRELFSTLTGVNPDDKPVLVKIGPDATRDGLEELVDIAHETGIDGFVATNTTTDHSDLESSHAGEWGGVSGKPVEEKSTRTVRTLAGLTDRPIVGVGGVRDAETAYRKIRAGASLVQLYTGLVYEGPSIARRINTGLVDRLDRDGFGSVGEAVGVDART